MDQKETSAASVDVLYVEKPNTVSCDCPTSNEMDSTTLVEKKCDEDKAESQSREHAVILAFVNDVAQQNLLDEGAFSPAFFSTTVDNFAGVPSLNKSFLNDSSKKISSLDDVNIHVVLGRAAYCNCLPVVEACLNNGARLDFRDAAGRNALHYGVAGNAINVVKYLIQYNSKKTFERFSEPKTDENQAPSSSTPNASVSTQDSTPADLNKINLCSEINDRDIRGWAPLHIAVCHDFVEMAKLLLESKADITLTLSHNSSPCRETPTHSQPIHFAAMRCHSSMFQTLLAYGATNEDNDDSKRLPLHYAVARGHVDFIKELLECGPKTVNANDCHNRTPLHIACLRGYKNVAELLVNYGAIVCHRDVWDLTPYDLAMTTGHSITGDYILSCMNNTGAGGESMKSNDESSPVGSAINSVALNSIETSVLGVLMTGLKETNIEQLSRCIRRLGCEFCLNTYKKTMDIQHHGGILIQSGKRKKTSGGIFLSLIQTDIRSGLLKSEDWSYITASSRERQRAMRAKNRQHVTRKILLEEQQTETANSHQLSGDNNQIIDPLSYE